jgi:hypothetical protein
LFVQIFFFCLLQSAVCSGWPSCQATANLNCVFICYNFWLCHYCLLKLRSAIWVYFRWVVPQTIEGISFLSTWQLLIFLDYPHFDGRKSTGSLCFFYYSTLENRELHPTSLTPAQPLEILGDHTFSHGVNVMYAKCVWVVNTLRKSYWWTANH